MQSTKPTVTLSELETIWAGLKVSSVEDQNCWWNGATVEYQVWLCARMFPRAGFDAASGTFNRIYQDYEKCRDEVQTVLVATGRIAGREQVDTTGMVHVANTLRANRLYALARLADAIDYFERVRKFPGMYATIAHTLHFAVQALELPYGPPLNIGYLEQARVSAPNGASTAYKPVVP